MKILNKIIYAIALASIILLGYFVTKLNMLPKKFYIPFIIVLVIWALIITFINIKVKKKILQILTAIVMILSVILNSAGIYYVYNTNKFFQRLSDVTETKEYYIIVKKDSKYEKLKDLKNKEIGLFDYETKNYKSAIKKLDASVKIKHKEYDNMSNLVDELLEDKTDAILINSNVKEILDENLKEFKTKTKVIDKIDITIKKETKKEPEKNNESFNILISGIDTGGDISTVSRSDVNIIVSVNRKTHEVVLTSVPRDMQVQLHGTTGLKDKLTHAGIYGIDMSRQTLEDFLEIKIDYYVRVNFTSVERIVDAIGGIDVDNDIAFSRGGRYYAQGRIHMNGHDTLGYCRERYKMPSGDWNRGLHQEEVIKAIITKVSTSTELLTNYSEIISSLEYLVQTNIPDNLVKEYIKDQLDTMQSWEINYYAVGGSSPDHQECYSAPGMKLYVTLPDEGHRQHAHKVITSINAGIKYNDIGW